MLISLQTGLEAVDVDVEAALRFAQLLADTGLLGGEALELLFLLGRQHERA